MPADQHIQQLGASIQILVRNYNNAQKEIKRLASDNQQMKEQLKKKEGEISELNEKVAAARLNLSSQDPASKKQLEKLINGYLKEIDTCLSLLNT